MNQPAQNPLRLLFWESTSRCNLACVHCRRQDIAEAAAKDDLTTAQMTRVLDSAATMGRPIIVFSGGEPLMRNDWETLASHAKTLGLPTALATNGTLVDAPMAAHMAAVGFHRVSISLDGADAATHDAFRGVAGAFDRACAGARHLTAAGVSIQINATIAAHNDHQLDALYDLARSLNACALHLFLLVPVGCGVEIEQSHQLPPQRYEQVLDWLCDRQAQLVASDGLPAAHSLSGHPAQSQPTQGHPGQSHPGHGHPGQAAFELKATCAPHYYRLAAQRGLLTANRGRGCLCGISVLFVSHKGQVFPCGYLPVECGDVRHQNLADIWRTSPVFADLRQYDKLKGKCGLCDFRALCGGCRARAFALTGDYLGAEPSCIYQPKRLDSSAD